jgi:hypothetical protein
LLDPYFLMEWFFISFKKKICGGDVIVGS